jgi:hypothetical protein
MRLVMCSAAVAVTVRHETARQRAAARVGAACPEAINSDVLWKLDAYRVAMYLLHTTQQDFRPDQLSRAEPWLVTQLVRAAGLIAANKLEGYIRSTRADRLRFLGYALARPERAAGHGTGLNTDWTLPPLTALVQPTPATSVERRTPHASSAARHAAHETPPV